MFITSKQLLLLSLLFSSQILSAQQIEKYGAIHSGVPWFDDKGKIVSAHGAGIIRDKGKFYLFGEAHSDTSNAFVGFNCYSSSDLYNWKFESIALPVQTSGKLGPNRVGERAKVLYSPKTHDYVMYMHVDTLGYKDQFIGYATSPTIIGPYTFQGALLFNGKPIKKWDMGVFQDQDQTGYVLAHGGEIYKLSDDYRKVISQPSKGITSGFESPTMFTKDGIYYFVGSNLTSWERNDNYYYSAPSIDGPWTSRGLFAPGGTLTWNSQSTYVLPIEGLKDTTYMFMGDRWSFPKQSSAATYVWQPMIISGEKISIPNYQDSWQINLLTGVAYPPKTKYSIVDNTNRSIKYDGKWQHVSHLGNLTESRSENQGSSLSITFSGKQIGIYSMVNTTNGYANVVISDKKGNLLIQSTVDMYAKSPLYTLVYMSPILAHDKYTLTMSVIGERTNWSDKKKTVYGSTAYFITLDKFIIAKK